MTGLFRLAAHAAFRAFGLAPGWRPPYEPRGSEPASRPIAGPSADGERWDAVEAYGWDVVQHFDGAWSVNDGDGAILADDHHDPRAAVDAAMRAKGIDRALRLFEGEG